MPPAASGRSSSYFPSLFGIPATVATAGTAKIVSFPRIQVNCSARRTCEHHVGHAECRCDRGATHLDVVGDQIDALQDLVEVRRDRDLADRERELPVLDPEALGPAREVPGDRVEAKPH